MKTLIILLVASFSNTLLSQDYVSVSGSRVELNNGQLIREIRMENGTLSSTGLFISGEERNYIRDSREFSFLANDKSLDGSSDWDLVGTEAIHDDRQGQGVKVILGGTLESVSYTHLTLPTILLV